MEYKKYVSQLYLRWGYKRQNAWINPFKYLQTSSGLCLWHGVLPPSAQAVRGAWITWRKDSTTKPNIAAATLRSMTTASTLARQVKKKKKDSGHMQALKCRMPAGCVSECLWLTFSGLLRGRERGGSGSQNDGLVWLTVVWPGHLRLVWVSPSATEPFGRWWEMASLLAEIIEYVSVYYG